MLKKIYFANDHAGFLLKTNLIAALKDEYECIDLGSGDSRVDYPDYSAALAKALKADSSAVGVAICGSGIGISIGANRYSHVRAALCHCAEYARLAREHNDANVIALGARFVAFEAALDMIKIFLSTPFSGAQHCARVQKLGELGRAD